jgi:alkanesulfonate monooxygenase SsuD/methylene tetrahydromethanopterin reductase-like flavin-dependent oxidoreductase (luciferase family)
MEEVISRLGALESGGHVHVTAAAGGPGARRVAARLADSVILTGDPYTDVAGQRDLVVDFLVSAGDRADQIEILTNLLIVGGGPVNEDLLRLSGLDAGRLLASDAVSVLSGGVNEMCDELERRRELFGTSYITVSETALRK